MSDIMPGDTIISDGGIVNIWDTDEDGAFNNSTVISNMKSSDLALVLAIVKSMLYVLINDTTGYVYVARVKKVF